MIGQALVAAVRTVEVRPPHSMHAYFLLPGDPKVPIIYDVDRMRDGKSFTTRRVTARQHGHPIFSMLVSFHTDEPGLDHQAKMPDVPAPEKLPSETDMREKLMPMMPDPVRRYYERERPIELRPVEFERYLGKKIPGGQFNIWIRTTGRLPDSLRSISACWPIRLIWYCSTLRLPRTGARCSKMNSWLPALIMRCGFTGRSVPTNGYCTRRIRRICTARGDSPGDLYSPATATGCLGCARRPGASATGT